jgi:hypothetical protein
MMILSGEYRVVLLGQVALTDRAVGKPVPQSPTPPGQPEVWPALGAGPAGDMLPTPFSDPPQVAAMLAGQIGGQVGV